MRTFDNMPEAAAPLVEELIDISRGNIAGSFYRGRLIAAVGEIPVEAASAAEAMKFVQRFGPLFADRIKDQLSKPTLTRLSRQRVIVRFKHKQRTAWPWFGAGLDLVFTSSRKGWYISELSANLPEHTLDLPPDPDRGPALAALNAAYTPTDFRSEVAPIELNPVAVDMGRLMGEPGSPIGMLHAVGQSARGPASILISVDGKRIISIGTPPDGFPPSSPIPQYHIHPATGVPSFVSFAPNGVLLPESASGDPVRVGKAFFSRYPTLLGTASVDTQLTVLKVLDADPWQRSGSTTVVFGQQFAGVPVWGAEVRVHLTSALAVRTLTGAYVRDPKVSTVPTLSQATALQAATATWIADHDDGPGLPSSPSGASLVILPLALDSRAKASNHLTWCFAFPEHYLFVSAHTGSVVAKVRTSHDVVQVWDSNNADKSKPSVGAVLQIRDGINLDPLSPNNSEAVVCENAISDFLGFLRSVFGRSGIDGHNNDVDAFIDVAPFNGFAEKITPGLFVFSQGSAVDDIVGHELTHGLVEATSGLWAFPEPGAINEGYADLFGKLVFPGTKPATWEIGKASSRGILRDLRDPEVSPKTYGITPPASYDGFVVTMVDQGGVHINAGILTRPHILLSDGDAAMGHTGLGRDRVATLAYYTVTRLLHPWSGFQDVLHCTWDAARWFNETSEQAFTLPRASSGKVAFDQSVIDELLWAFNEVGLNPFLNPGWFHVSGNSTQTHTLFKGVNFTDGSTIAEVSILLGSPWGNLVNYPPTMLREAAGPRSLTDDGVTATILAPFAVGTSNAETILEVVSPNFIDLDVAPHLTIIAPPASPGMPNPTLPTIPQETPNMIHGCVDPFCGHRYADIIYAGDMLQLGCTVENVELELLDDKGRFIATHTLGAPFPSSPGFWGSFGAGITARTLGGPGLLVCVESWHCPFASVSYRLRYYTRGGGCALPIFKFTSGLL